MLAPAERTRYEAYRQPADRLRFLTGRVLARTVAGRYLGVPPTSVELDATCPDCGKQHGKPRIPGNDLELSISHAGQRVGLAVAVGTSIGLDVESTSRSSGDDLLNYALSDAELDAVAGRPAAERARLFFTYWARKEALMKATGLGLKVPLRSITLAPPEAPPALLASAHDALDPATTAIVDLDAGQGYAAAVAALTANGLTVNQRWWRAADFGELKPSR
ncbi:4'-phosphopantetheinyl transferase superfamily protein [Thermocrispum sp.]|uniref:4'-phosphopantetheinyl transferase family protein n=1 Tax=Thermocrispum sp. TaxID=2060768 RepID=UPI00257BC598|nr:4'-phosphopantetheinyl transferase superfamily protein [Thermocrispum sp.]